MRYSGLRSWLRRSRTSSISFTWARSSAARTTTAARTNQSELPAPNLKPSSPDSSIYATKVQELATAVPSALPPVGGFRRIELLSALPEPLKQRLQVKDARQPLSALAAKTSQGLKFVGVVPDLAITHAHPLAD